VQRPRRKAQSGPRREAQRGLAQEALHFLRRIEPYGNNNKIEIDAGTGMILEVWKPWEINLGWEIREGMKSGKARKDMGTLPARRLKWPFC